MDYKENLLAVDKGLDTNQPLAHYVHGLASGANAATAIKIAEAFPDYEWSVADYGECIEENVQKLNDIVAHHSPHLIVGTSMGGLTVLYADAPNAIKVVINPALSIADCVRNTIGLGKHPYFCKRMNGAKEFELTEEMCRAYEEYIATHKPLLGRENYAIFATHDELLGDEASARAQELLRECGFKVLIDPNGAHRLQPSTLEMLQQLVSHSVCCSKI